MSTQKFTKQIIDSLALPDGKAQHLEYDALLTGFGVRVNKSKKVFFLERRINGKPKRISICNVGDMTLEDARNHARMLIGEIAKGSDPVAQRKAKKIEGLPLKDVYLEFIKVRRNLKPVTVHDYNRAVIVYLEDWLTLPWTAITQELVVAKHGAITKKNGAARANNTMRVLRTILNFAMSHYRTPEGNRVVYENAVRSLTDLRAWNRVEPRSTYIKPHQIAAWMKAVLELRSDNTREYFMFTLFTGARKTEAATLRWKDVDFEDRTFVFTDPKNRNPLRLPLSQFLYALLWHKKARSESDYVFASYGKKGYYDQPKAAYDKVLELSGIRFTMHDLRRTFITVAESLDIPTYALKALVNHKLGRSDVTSQYVQMTPERLREPTERIAQWLLDKSGLLTIEDVGKV